MSDKLNVIALEEHDGEFKKVNDNIVALREQMKSDREATKLDMDQRKDDVAKYEAAFEDIEKRTTQLTTDLAETRRLAAATMGDNELKGELEMLAAGGMVGGDEEADYRAVKPEQGQKFTAKQIVEGVLRKDGTWHEPKHEQLQRLAQLNDDCLLVDAILSKRNGGAYQANGGMRSLGIHKELMRLSEATFKADTDFVDTTEIANWVPTHFSSRVWNLIKLGLPELNIFQEIPMPAKTFELNVNLSDVTGDVVAETTTIAGANPFADLNMQAVNDAKVTLTAAKFRGRAVFSGEATEDAIVPQLQLLRDHIIRALREAKADAIMNGDAAGNLDTGGTHFGRANPAAGVDPRTAFDGLRSFLADNTSTPNTSVAIGGDLTGLQVLSIRATQDEWGVDESDLVVIQSPVGYLRMLQDANLLTVDKVGPQATLITGSKGTIAGSNLIVSRRMPKNMNASGVMDGITTTKTAATVVNRRGAIIGNRRRETIGMDHYGATDSSDLFVFSRMGFAQLFGNSYPWIAGGINISTS